MKIEQNPFGDQFGSVESEFRIGRISTLKLKLVVGRLAGIEIGENGVNDFYTNGVNDFYTNVDTFLENPFPQNYYFDEFPKFPFDRLEEMPQHFFEGETHMISAVVDEPMNLFQALSNQIKPPLVQ